MSTRRDARKEGRQMHFWATKETADRMERLLATNPFGISQSGVLQRGLVLALDELEKYFYSEEK